MLPKTSRPGTGELTRVRRLAMALFCAALAVAALAPGPAHAADEPPRPKLTEAQKQEIRDRYDRATRYYYLRKYDAAIAEYEAIYLLSADPVMLYNIAQSYRNGDQPETASQFYKNYLRNAPNASNKADVEKKIAEMDRLAEERKRSGVTPTPAPAPVPVAPPAATPPPVAGPSSEPVVGPPPPVAVPPTTSPPPMPDPAPTTMSPEPMGSPTDIGARPAPAERRPSRVLRWSMLVGGGVLLTTSFVFASVASSKAKEVQAASVTRTRVFDADLQKVQKDGRAASALAVGTGLLGAIGVGAGVYLWLTESSRERAEARTLVVPVAGPGYAGALVRASF